MTSPTRQYHFCITFDLEKESYICCAFWVPYEVYIKDFSKFHCFPPVLSSWWSSIHLLENSSYQTWIVNQLESSLTWFVKWLELSIDLNCQSTWVLFFSGLLHLLRLLVLLFFSWNSLKVMIDCCQHELALSADPWMMDSIGRERDQIRIIYVISGPEVLER